MVRSSHSFFLIGHARVAHEMPRMDLPVHAVNSILDMEVTRMNYNLLSGLDGH